MTSSTNALRKLLKDLGMEGALSLGRIAGKWSALFNGPLSKHTSPEALSADTLTVNVDSPSWLHQANFYKAQMISRLAPYGIRSVRFRQGPVRKPETPKVPVYEPGEITGDAREEVERMLECIVDSELRESIRCAALRSFSEMDKVKGSGRRQQE